MSLPLNATRVGTGTVAVRITGPGDFDLERSYTLAAKPATQVLTRRTVRQIARGESLTISNDLLTDLVPGTGAVALSVGPSTALDVPALLKALDRYPFGCSEQITSRALPLLYVNELAAEAHLALDTAVDQRIREAIDRVLARQGSDGSFGLWTAGGEDAWLDAYVTDFLTRARERGFAVPDVAFRLALDRLRNQVSIAPEPNKNGGRELAYALYVLARNGAAPIGDLRYLADTKLGDLATPIAKAQIAAALAVLGDRARAERVYAAALEAIPEKPALEIGRVDYGSVLRDCRRPGDARGRRRRRAPDHPQRGRAGRNGARADALHLHPGECVAGARRPRARQGGHPGLARRRRRGAPGPALSHRARSGHRQRPLKVTNTGDATLQAVVSVTGAPVTPEPAADRGFKIERTYYTLDGEKADVAKVKQNQRFAVVLKITEPKPKFARVIVADYLPAGFEIDNPRLVSSGDTGTLSWIEDAGEPVERRVPRRPLRRRVRPQGRRQGDLHGRLRGARGVARALRAAAGLCGGHVSSRPLRPHRHRNASRSRRSEPSPPYRARGRRARRGGCIVGDGRLRRGARPGAGRTGRRIFHRRARSRRAAAAAVSDLRGPLAPARHRGRRRSAPSRPAVRLRGQALPLPFRRRSRCALCAPPSSSPPTAASCRAARP